MPVHDLKELLRHAQPKLQAGDYVFVTLLEWPALSQSDILMSFRESEGITLILEQAIADKNDLQYEYVAAWITMEVNSALDAVGFTAAFATALGQQNISCNVVAAFHHDHLFVAKEDGARAVDVLQKL
jgi:hypothetical protein